jgi:hypothetical protein
VKHSLAGPLRIPWPFPAALLIAVMTWPVPSTVPTYGLDPSWRTALHMLVAGDVGFRDIAFTYGPLGFLEIPVNAEPFTLFPALLWTLLLQIGLAWLLIECLRRALPAWATLVVAYLACRLLDDGREVLPAIALLWVGLTVQWGVPARVGRVLLPISGLIAGAAILIKINQGSAAVVLGGIAAWWLGPRGMRALGIFAASVVAGVLVPWAILGNGVKGIGDWLVASVRVAAGYSAGLPFEDPSLSWEYPLFISVMAVLAYCVFQGSDAPGLAPRLAMLGAAAIFAFATFKHGFVRHDLGHSPSSFTALIPLSPSLRRQPFPPSPAACIAACAMAIVGAVVTHGGTDAGGVADIVNPSQRVAHAGDALALAVSPSRRADEREEARVRLQRHHFVPLAVLDAVRGRSVHVGPYETSLAWAHELDWQPLPAFQDYVIVSNALDRGNADALRSDRAPERILRHAGARIDGHSAEGEGPEQLLAMICVYREVLGAPGWQVLARATPRCGPERPISSVTADAGERITVPAAPRPNDLVLARVQVHVPLLERLRSAAFKPAAVPLLYFGPELLYRVPAAVARGPLLMRTPAAGIGWSDHVAAGPNEPLQPYRVDLDTLSLASG